MWSLTSKNLLNFVFLFWAPFSGALAGLASVIYGLKIDGSSMSSISMGGFFPFSMTSAFLLITMPRSDNVYLKNMDANRRTLPYSLVLATPGFLSLFSAFSGSILTQDNTALRKISTILFISSIFSFFWAVWIIKQIVVRISDSGRISRKNL